MLHLDLQTSIPTFGAVTGVLQHYSDSIGVPLDYDRLLEYYSYFTISSTNKMHALANYIGLSKDFKAKDFLSYILSIGVKEGLLLTKGGAYSLDAKSLTSAIETGLYSEEVTAILKSYREASSERASVSMFKGIIDSTSPQRNLLTFDKRRLCFVNPRWSVLNTGRLQMSEPALFNVAKILCDIATAPEGWVLLEVDSGQIEPRIIYSHYIDDPQIKKLINLYNDAYYGLLHYVTMPIEHIITNKMDFVAHEIDDEMAKKRKHLKTLGNAVNYGSNNNDLNDPLKVAYIERIGKHPKRLKWVNDINNAVEGGQTIFKTAFGTPIDITKGHGGEKYGYGTPAHTEHLKRCALNNPIQGTAADLMRYSVMQANKILQTEAQNSFMVKYTHDSGTFCIHESEYDRVGDKLGGITQYSVADWIPIYGDPEIGKKVHEDILPLLI